jgi:hypothetical protein
VIPTYSDLTRDSLRQLRRFRRSFVTVVAVFGLISSAALAGYALQGPRLREATVDVVRAVSQPQTLLRLDADRPLDPAANYRVEIVPDIPHQVRVEGPSLAVVFDRALRYGTTYEVTISGVREEGGFAQSTWQHEFVTPVANLWFLDRDSGGGMDRILRVSTGSEPPQVLYEAPGIALFTPVGSAVVVVTEAAGGDTGMLLVEPVTRRAETILLPRDTDIVDLFAPASGTRVYFTLRSRGSDTTYDRTLFSFDTAGSRTPTVVSDLSGKAIRATKAFSVPGDDRLIVWVDDVSVEQVNMTTGLVLPIMSEAQELWGVSTDGRSIVAVDVGGTVAVNIDDLSEQRLPVGPIGGRQAFEGDTYLTASGFSVAKLAVSNQAGTEFTSLLAIVNSEGAVSVLYRTPGDEGSIGRFRVSPNDQYVAIEVVPNLASQVLDGRQLAPRDTAITTVVIDIDRALVVRSVEGFWPVW